IPTTEDTSTSHLNDTSTEVLSSPTRQHQQPLPSHKDVSPEHSRPSNTSTMVTPSLRQQHQQSPNNMTNPEKTSRNQTSDNYPVASSIPPSKPPKLRPSRSVGDD